MLRKMALTLFAAALLAAVNLFAPCTPSAAQAASATGTDFSAQQQQGKKHKKRKAAPARKSAPRAARHQRAAPRAASARAAPREQATQGHTPRGQATQGHARARPGNAQGHAPRDQATQGQIARCRSAGGQATRQPSRHRVAYTWGARARHAPRRHSRPQLLGVAQRTPRPPWQRLAHIWRAQHRWAPSWSAQMNTTPTPTFRRPSPIAKA